jgi:hypothetical protein
VRPLLQNDPRFLAIASDEERHEVFEDYMDELDYKQQVCGHINLYNSRENKSEFFVLYGIGMKTGATALGSPK